MINRFEVESKTFTVKLVVHPLVEQQDEINMHNTGEKLMKGKYKVDFIMPLLREDPVIVLEEEKGINT